MLELFLMKDDKNIPEVNMAEPDNINPELNSNNKFNKLKENKWVVISVLGAVLVVAGVVSWILVSRGGSTTLTSSTVSSTSSTSAPSTTQTSSNIPDAINPINPAAIPLGTGNVSTSPKVGYVDFCSYTGKVAAEPNLPWINQSSNTWNSETKPSVEGSVSWSSQASYTNSVSGSTRTITTNDLPINHDTGVFPISTSDPAYQYDHNPNTIKAQPTTWKLSANPTAASSPSCTRDGPVGVLTDGVFIFNALDAQNRDAGATEILDQWQGHPQSNGVYHHHTIPNFMLKKYTAKNSSTLVGYALDGYGIYIERDKNGNLLTNANLDECHGRTSEVMWNGKMTNIYHYDVTEEYPYTVGCYHGSPISITLSGPATGASARPAPAG